VKKTYELSPASQNQWDELTKDLASLESHNVKVTLEVSKRRTLTQNSAIHKYCELLAAALSDSGYDMVRTLRILRKTPDIELQWTMESVKEYLWRPVQVATTEKQSSSKLDRAEVSRVYEELNKYTANKLGVSLPFPSNRP